MVAPVPNADDEHVVPPWFEPAAESFASKFASKVGRAIFKRWGWGFLRFVLVGGSGAGMSYYVAGPDDVPEHRDAAASGPSPEPPPIETIDTCDQARRDARLAIETCAHQAVVCGAAEDDVPRADPPIQRFTDHP